ncbi:MAG: sulfotransferase domain-containing protein [Planctomycetota bacterium]|nr:sulfotransferase domain-containing protein [Planctomycetota bacterium]
MTRDPTTVAYYHAPPPRRFHRWTAGVRPLPDFLILGAQKAGTTSLHRYIELHPSVLKPRVKEVHFFDVQWWRGLRYYRGYFPTSLARAAARLRRGGPTITGEASPYYLAHPQVPARVRETLPKAPLIVLLRDPVERAYSHYLHNLRLGAEDCATFEEAVEAEPQRLEGEVERMLGDDRYESFAHRHHSYLLRGCYAAQLRAWFELFPREQFLVLDNAELGRDPAGVYARVLDFLGLPQWQPPHFEHHNTGGKSAPLEPAMQRRLAQHYERHNQELYELLGRDFGWTRP